MIDGRLSLCDEVLTPDSSRFWSAADTRAGKFTVKDDGTIGPATAGFPDPSASAGAVRSLRALAVACFAVCAVAVLYGIFLIVPAFH